MEQGARPDERDLDPGVDQVHPPRAEPAAFALDEKERSVRRQDRSRR